ncbi:MAG: tRNA pseudouridine(54/55) synthase Pus10 [Asgard group archaeon]|nr:tRNA pseudouridine(54/55) synthase Pus10 [Asgard group archaeon]
MIENFLPLLKNHDLCKHCLGRQYALLGYGLTNVDRSIILQNSAVLELYPKLGINKEITKAYIKMGKMGNKLAQKALLKANIPFDKNEEIQCELCEGLFQRLSKIGESIYRKIADEEFQTYLVGARIDTKIMEREDRLRSQYNITTGESIKSEFTRELGKWLGKKTGTKVDFKNPDLTVIVDLIKQEIELHKKSVYIYGRYQKLVRTIPQTKWPCHHCNGKGCEICEYTGKMYEESVEELIGEPILEIVGGSGTKFHGAGREDIDAKMLGSGRPFVIEILDPNRRSINLRKIKRKVNKYARKKVKISNLKKANKETIQKIKGSSTNTRKTYRALVEFEEEISDKDIQKLKEELTGKTIVQRTPQRVEHRRADKKRLRQVHKIEIEKLNHRKISVLITTDGGLYIKELISGDDDRTKPSFASILDMKALCKKLDVMKIHMKYQNN